MNQKLGSSETGGWLSKTRIGLLLSGQTIANRLGITRSAYSRLEQAEVTGAISLKNLAAAAEAMDCELVYTIRPKSQKSLAEEVWQRILEEAKKHPRVTNAQGRNWAAALAAAARETMLDARFRKSRGWSRHCGPLNSRDLQIKRMNRPLT